MVACNVFLLSYVIFKWIVILLCFQLRHNEYSVVL